MLIFLSFIILSHKDKPSSFHPTLETPMNKAIAGESEEQIKVKASIFAFTSRSAIILPDAGHIGAAY